MGFLKLLRRGVVGALHGGVEDLMEENPCTLYTIHIAIFNRIYGYIQRAIGIFPTL